MLAPGWAQECAPDVVELARQPLAARGKRAPAGRREPLDDQADASTANVRVDGANQLGHDVRLRYHARNLAPATRVTAGHIMKKRTANILLAVVGTVVVCVLLLVVGGVWLAASVFHRQTASEATAMATLDAARARFKGASPVFEVQPNGPALSRPIPGRPGAPLRTMHFILWNADEQTLTQADVPLALLWLSDSPIDVMQFADSHHQGSAGQRMMSIRLSELERFGSALLLDHELEDGHRLLVWTE
jgi:hypothetical protein